MPKLTYPDAPRLDLVEDYHGTPVPDPYRWLEDVDSPQTTDWVRQQNELTFGFLETIPARNVIRKRLTSLWDFPRTSAPAREGTRYFQLRNSGLQNQDVLYVFDHLDSEPRLLLDPNTLSEDGTVALSTWKVSQDARWLAYATSASGSDWQTWHVRDVNTAIDLPDEVEWSKFSSATWLPDSSGFYYSRYPQPEKESTHQQANYNHQLFFHKLGTPQLADRLIYERPDQKEWGFDASLSEDDHYLVLSVWQGTDTRNRVFYQDLQAEGSFVELLPDLEALYQFVGNDGPVFYFRTDLDAPRCRLIAIDTHAPGKENWRTIIPESTDTLENLTLVHDQFIALYVQDASHRLRRFNLQGVPLGEISFPTLGSLIGLTGRRAHDELFYAFTSFVHPTSIYRYNFRDDTSREIFSPAIQFDFSPYQTRQVFVNSPDGTRVPMFLVHKTGLQNDSKNPTLLYGYGGFAISLLPSFSISRLVWLESGGVLAVANLRGGGEYGEDWHKAGMLDKKTNVFEDFIACAEYLISEGITSTPRLAIQGGSNGGLLVGACMTRRPDLFGVCLPAVGVMDMLRFHKFTIGWAWVSDYGSSEDPTQFKNLLSYSPYHNLVPGTLYPTTLVTTADHDDRVVPGHSFKFAAALQHAQAGDNPTIIRIQTKAGHGAGKPTSILIAEIADIFAFAARMMNIEDRFLHPG